MTRYIVKWLAAAVIAAALSPASASAQTVPAMPANLTVPDGHTLFLAARATGTQNYICQLEPGGPAWRFLGPQATLFQGSGSELLQQVTTHFLSADQTPEPVARPTWQHSFDSSKVWARLRASSTDPAYVAAGAIPWLLLEAANTQPGPTGGDVLAQTTFIQRLATSGGLAPASGCSKVRDAGTVALVPYETDYYFYRAAQEN